MRSKATNGLARNEALEQAIIDAPLDPVPRMVYADWIQATGDRRGEWMALHAAIERDPQNVRLRSLAIDFLGRHLELLLGAGKHLLVGAWIGWRGGFIDELRVQPFEGQRQAAAAFSALLAHPSCRFVRCVGIGDVKGGVQAALEALVAAAPPLLDTVIACDTPGRPGIFDGDVLARIPTLRRLGLHHVSFTKPLPQLVELSFDLGHLRGDWFEIWIASGACPNLEALTIDCRSHEGAQRLRAILAAVPKLRTLRLLYLMDADDLIDAVSSLRALELLDLSHSSVTDVGIARLVGRRLHVVALRTAVSEEMASRVVGQGGSILVSARLDDQAIVDLDDDLGESGGWLHHRLVADGRHGLRLMPGIGRLLYTLGTRHSDRRGPIGVQMLEASLTLPTKDVAMWTWANAAIAHAERLQLDEAELIAREGLLRTSKEPNLHSCVLDALRRTGRNAEAVAMLPKALASLTAPKGPGAHADAPAACLADCLLVLAQANRHRDVIALGKEHRELVQHEPRMFASLAMSLVALGKPVEARGMMAHVSRADLSGLVCHGRAVLALAGPRPSVTRALEFLTAAKAAAYADWHWVASDPNLAKLAGHAEFERLLRP